MEILNVFNTLTLKQTFSKKVVPFLVESAKTEYASFPQKTGISEANVKTNRIVSPKWAYHKEPSFDSNYFIFLKILFRLKNLLQRVVLMYQRLKCP